MLETPTGTLRARMMRDWCKKPATQYSGWHNARMHEIDQAPFRAALSNGFKAGVAGSAGFDELARMPSAEIKLTWKRGYEQGRRRRALALDDMDEHKHQCLLMAWAETMTPLRPELELIYAVPNAGKRTPRQGAYMKAEGLRPGFPDVGLPTAAHGHYGLFIELKTLKGRLTPEQGEWLHRLNRAGYAAHMCRGWLSAVGTIERYLDGLL